MNTLTPLLGVDKSNPLLELLVNPDFPDEILVHYGMHLLEKVRRGQDSIEEKLLAGRLYNAGIKRCELVKIFKRDLKTIRHYAEALKSGDAERLKSALSGQGSPRKIGVLEDRFIRQELSEKLGIEVCYETVRKILKEEKAKLTDRQAIKPSSCCDTDPVLVSVDIIPEEMSKKAEKKENSCKKTPSLSSNLDQKHNHSPSFPINSQTKEETGKVQFLFHGGLFLVLDSIGHFSTDLCTCKSKSVSGWLTFCVEQSILSKASGYISIHL